MALFQVIGDTHTPPIKRFYPILTFIVSRIGDRGVFTHGVENGLALPAITLDQAGVCANRRLLYGIGEFILTSFDRRIIPQHLKLKYAIALT